MMKQNVAGMLSLVDENYVSEADPTQSKPKQKLSWQKLTAIAASICVFVSVLVISILIPTMNSDKPPIGNTGLESGFTASSGEPIPDNWCAYKSATNEFDIDNVTLTFYFGTIMPKEVTDEYIENYLENGINIPEFDVYFGDTYCNPLYLIRHSTENFISTEYSCYIEDYYSKEVNIIYNHSETVTIPQELFTRQQGAISFYISGTDINELEPEYKMIACILMNYDIKDGKIVLSKWDGKRT